MAKSSAERVREHRERLRKADLSKVDSYLREPFSAYVAKADHAQGAWSILEESLASVGISVPEFDDDLDRNFDPLTGEENRGSLGRAERMLGAFIDAATELAGMINTYKQWSIDQRITELMPKASGKYADPSVRDEILLLTELKLRLRKDTRLSLKSTGTA